MISRSLHKWERLIFYAFVILILLFVSDLFFINVNYSSVVQALYMSIIILVFITFFRFRKWKKQGYALSRKLGLKKIIVFETDLITKDREVIYEIHHKPISVLQGFKKRRRKREEILSEWKQELKEDFYKLYKWSLNENVAFISYTHQAMERLWKKSSQKYFAVQPIKEISDPFAKPPLIQWIFISFSSTGRIAKRPNKWRGIGFKRREVIEKRGNLT